MKIMQLNDPAFRQYGRAVEGICTGELMKAMEHKPRPDGVVYVASDPELEALPIFETFTRVLYGGMPIQIGYCSGSNHKLNALEYHRDSEFNLACTDGILLLGAQQDIDPADFSYDTSRVEAFFVPKGTLVECYATTLHYAPIASDERFSFVVVLPRGTNEALPFPAAGEGESKLLTHVNKWLIAHPEANIQGAHAGLTGENLCV